MPKYKGYRRKKALIYVDFYMLRRMRKNRILLVVCPLRGRGGGLSGPSRKNTVLFRSNKSSNLRSQSDTVSFMRIALKPPNNNKQCLKGDIVDFAGYNDH